MLPINTLKGGNIRMESYNPYGSPTYVFNGNSHANGGIQVDTDGDGKSNAEVEGGETLHYNTQGEPVVTGNLFIPGTKTKFKSAFKAISKEENITNKMNIKGNMLMENSDPDNKYEFLSHNSGNIMAWSSDRKQKALAQEKENLSQVQQAIHSIANITGMDAKDISSYKNGGILSEKKSYTVVEVPEFKGGGNLSLAERNNNPGNMRDEKGNFIHYNSYEEGMAALQNKLNNAIGGKSKVYSAAGNLYDFYNHYAPKSDNNDPKTYAETVAKKLGVNPNTPINQLGDKIPLWAKATTEQEDSAYSKKSGIPSLPIVGMNQTNFQQPIINQRETYSDIQPLPFINKLPEGNGQYSPTQINVGNEVRNLQQQYQQTVAPQKRTPSLADSNKLKVTDVLPEIAAMFDKPAPVLHERLDPQLYQPYNVSFQDRLNQNNSSFKGIQQNLTNNPEALSVLAGQKYGADSQILADQFRTNQSIDSDVTNKNIQLINTTREKNLQLADTQFVRQTQASDNTRRDKWNAINSISNKIAQNRAQNNDIKMVESQFQYRFNPSTGKMDYVGGPANLNTNGGMQQNSLLADPTNTTTYEPDGNGGYKVKKIVDNPIKKRKFGGKL